MPRPAHGPRNGEHRGERFAAEKTQVVVGVALTRAAMNFLFSVCTLCVFGFPF
jgi:hypothetical protein